MPRPPSRRPGFSLLEVMLVCAILVFAAAMAYPSMKNLHAYYKLQGAVDSVRAIWAQARAKAIEEGRPYRFGVEDQGTNFRVAPDDDSFWGGGQGSSGGMVMEESLPAGVRFTTGGNDSGSGPAEDNSITSKQQTRTVSPASFVKAAVFLPDGSARQDVRIVFRIAGVRPMAVRLRGLTGTSSVETLSE